MLVSKYVEMQSSDESVYVLADQREITSQRDQREGKEKNWV
jgi:hypothetical protein